MLNIISMIDIMIDEVKKVRAAPIPDDFFNSGAVYSDGLVQIIFYGRVRTGQGLGEAIILTGKS